MLPDDVQEKLDFFKKDKFIVNDTEVELKEKSKSGKACIKCKLNKETLIFTNPEQNTLPYLDGNTKNATSCADKFLFELDTDGKWILHVMELKKTINPSSVAKSKTQFVMGIYNARALAAFLNIQIKEIYVYSAYRNDKIESTFDLIQLRTANIDPDVLKIVREWKKGKCSLTLDLEEITFVHEKIQLDRNGYGECELRQ